MKIRLLFSIILINLTYGCATEHTSEFRPIENGFGFVTHVKGFTDRSLSAGLCYRDSSSNITEVWPHLLIVSGNNIVVTNQTVLLIGGRAEVYPDGKERVTERLIAFKGPAGPPLDVTDQLIQKWSAQSGAEITNYIKDSFVSLTKTNDAIQIEFVFVKLGERGPGTVNAHGTTLVISWREIEAIIQDVSKNGKLKKEKRSGFEYLQKD